VSSGRRGNAPFAVETPRRPRSGRTSTVINGHHPLATTSSESTIQVDSPEGRFQPRQKFEAVARDTDAIAQRDRTLAAANCG